MSRRSYPGHKGLSGRFRASCHSTAAISTDISSPHSPLTTSETDVQLALNKLADSLGSASTAPADLLFYGGF